MWKWLCLATSVGLAVGCSSQPVLQPLASRMAVVGAELEIPLFVDHSAGAIEFSYRGVDLDLTMRSPRPTITPYAGGEAVFHWLPLASDLGDHRIAFTATSGGRSSTQTAAVSVVSGPAPLHFREPIGDGTTLDLHVAMCAEVALLVDDTGSTDVTFMPGASWADNAAVTKDGPLKGRLRFCPSSAQAAASSIFPLDVVAMDATGAQTTKRYTIVLGTVQGPGTPGTCGSSDPVITYSAPTDVVTVNELAVVVEVADPNGISEVALFFSTTPPANPQAPDLNQMIPIDTVPLSGTDTDAQFGTSLVSPVAGQPSGTQATVYYVVRATDAESSIAGCTARSTVSPVYSVTFQAGN